MTILVTYGFHDDEKDFGREVAQEFKNIYDSNIKFYEIVNSTHHDRCEREDRTFDEQILAVKDYSPSVVIDLHHSMGTFRPPSIEQAKRYYDQDPDFLNLYRISHPLIAFYENEHINEDISKFIKSKEAVCFFENKYYPEEFKVQDKPSVHYCSSKNIPFVGLESMINAEQNLGAIKDDDYFRVMDITMRFLKDFDGYLSMKNQ